MPPTVKKPSTGTKAATQAKPGAVAKKLGVTPLKKGTKTLAKPEPASGSLSLESSGPDGTASTVAVEDQAGTTSVSKLQEKQQIGEVKVSQTSEQAVKKDNGDEKPKSDVLLSKMTSPASKKQKKGVSISATPAKIVEESKEELKDVVNGKESVPLQQTNDTDASKKKGSQNEPTEMEVEASEEHQEIEDIAEQNDKQDEGEEEEDEGEALDDEENEEEYEEGAEEDDDAEGHAEEEHHTEEAALEEMHDIAQEHESKHGTERQKRKRLEVFVGGLDGNASEGDVKKALEHVGEIVDVRVMRDLQTGKSKGYAFVRFATADQASHAVTDIGKMQIRGRLCEIGPSAINDVLYIGNINKYWKKEQVDDKLKELGVGGIEELTLMEDPHNPGINRGFAFLELVSHTDANKAFRRLQMPDAVFGFNRSAKVAWAEPEEEPDEAIMSQVKSVFVDGLPALWTEEKVKHYFDKFGEIERIVLARNMPTARRKDFGFINFSTRESALACIDAFKDTDMVDGENKYKVKITLARPAPKVKPKAVKGIIRGDHPIGGGGPVVWRNQDIAYPRPDFRGAGRGGRSSGPIRGDHRMPGRVAGRGYEYTAPRTAPQEEMWYGEYEDEMYQYETPRDRQFPGPPQRVPRAPPREPYFRREELHPGRGSYRPSNEFRQDDYGHDYPPAPPPRRYGVRPPPQGRQRDAGFPSMPSNRPSRLPPPQVPPRDEGFPIAQNNRPVRPPPAQGQPPHHGEGFPARNDRRLAYEHDMGSVYDRPHDYPEGVSVLKRPFSALADDRGYYEAGPRGYPRARTDLGDAPPPQSHFDVDRPPFGRPGVERKPVPPLSTGPGPQSGAFDHFGAGHGGRADSFYSSENHTYGTSNSGAPEYKASAGETVAAFYGGHPTGYNYSAPSGPYF